MGSSVGSNVEGIPVGALVALVVGANVGSLEGLVVGLRLEAVGNIVGPVAEHPNVTAHSQSNNN